MSVQLRSCRLACPVLSLLDAGSETAQALIADDASKWYWSPVFATTMPMSTSVTDLPLYWHAGWVVVPVLALMFAELALVVLSASSCMGPLTRVWASVFPDVVSLVYGLCDAAGTLGLCHALFACTYCRPDASDVLAPVRG